jgi:hypothetical protein
MSRAFPLLVAILIACSFSSGANNTQTNDVVPYPYYPPNGPNLATPEQRRKADQILKSLQDQETALLALTKKAQDGDGLTAALQGLSPNPTPAPLTSAEHEERLADASNLLLKIERLPEVSTNGGLFRSIEELRQKLDAVGCFQYPSGPQTASADRSASEPSDHR